MLRMWNASIEELVGKFIHLETRDGSQREGKVTGTEYFRTKVNSKIFEIPKALELNGDPSDKIEWAWIEKLKVD